MQDIQKGKMYMPDSDHVMLHKYALSTNSLEQVIFYRLIIKRFRLYFSGE